MAINESEQLQVVKGLITALLARKDALSHLSSQGGIESPQVIQLFNTQLARIEQLIREFKCLTAESFAENKFLMMLQPL